MTTRLDGKLVAEALDQRTKSELAARRQGTPPPLLVSLHRGVDSPYQFYLRSQARHAAALGIEFREERLAPADGPQELIARLLSLDRDPAVHGVIVEHPLPAPFDFFQALEGLRPVKDIDGVSSRSLGRQVAQRPIHVPAVARAALQIARHYHLPVEGERTVVIGRSETVGLPLAVLLASRPPGGNSSVSVVHSQTRDLTSAIDGARTIFSCAGRPGLLDRTVVPKGAHVVDIGLSSAPDPSRPTGSRAVGDADPVSLEGWAGSLTPVPGGVGPVTVAELMANTVRAWRLQASGSAGS